MKNIIGIIFCALLSAGIVFGTAWFDNDAVFAVNQNANQSIIDQEILEYTKDARSYYKIYEKGRLLGVISDISKMYRDIQDIYESEYAEQYPNTKMSFGEDVYVTQEQAYYIVENVDEQILAYLKKNDGLGIETNVIDFSTEEGIYATIYVDDIDKFNNAKEKFLENFISKEELRELTKSNEREDLKEPGTQSIGFRVQENITSHRGVAIPEKIMTDEKDILEFLCFGENTERRYYEVKEGETLQGVGFNNSDLSPTQIMMLNPDKIHSVDQILEPGMKLNVTYFDSPITVVVTKERLALEDAYPETAIYIESKELFEGSVEIVQNEEAGQKYSLYEETWVNGVLIKGEEKSSSMVIQPTQGIIRVGVLQKPNVGTGKFRWPIDNPSITCGWYCYFGHQAIDLQNMYVRYDSCYAADNGTVITNSYDDISGNYVVIDHNNGFQTYYGHLNKRSELKVGDTILKGEVIGQIGMTGLATGPHVHFEIRVDGVKHNPCEFMNCNAVPYR